MFWNRPICGSAVSSQNFATGRQAFASAFDFAPFDRFPTLKFVLLESGGGCIGSVVDRLDGAHQATFKGKRSPIRMGPSDYFRGPTRDVVAA